MGNQGGEHGSIGIRSARLIAGERTESAGEAAKPVDLQQDILEPNSGYPALNEPTQGADFRRDRQCVRTTQA